MDKQKVKLIFLDFDGVLNNDSWNDYRYATMVGEFNKTFDTQSQKLDPINIQVLQRLIDMVPDAMIVFSTSWKWSQTVDSLIDTLESSGLIIDKDRFFGKTPDLFGHFALNRADEINKFFDEFDQNHPDKEITSFAILDDVDIMKNLKDNWVLTKMENGLTLDNIHDAYYMLTIEETINRGLELEDDLANTFTVTGFDVDEMFV